MIRQTSRSLLLALLMLAIGGIGLVAAAARGQTRAGGEVIVLCSGGGLVQVTLDATGQPTGETHLCPDLALVFLSALDIALPDLTRLPGATEVPVPDLIVAPAARIVPVFRARGPPVPA